MKTQSRNHLKLLACAALVLASPTVVSGFQGHARQHYSRQFHVLAAQRPLSRQSTSTISRKQGFCRIRIRLSASTQDQDSFTPSSEIDDESSPSGPEDDRFHLPVVDQMELLRAQNGADSVEPVEASWSYWSTGSQLVQAGSVGATTGLLVAIFKLVRTNVFVCLCSIVQCNTPSLTFSPIHPVH
jgi:hypothetical protein